MCWAYERKRKKLRHNVLRTASARNLAEYENVRGKKKGQSKILSPDWRNTSLFVYYFLHLEKYVCSHEQLFVINFKNVIVISYFSFVGVKILVNLLV